MVMTTTMTLERMRKRSRSSRQRKESRGILNLLFEHCAQPHWQMRFRWEPDSIAFWDNRCVQHYAIWDYWPNVRSGYRMFVKGTERPKAA